MTARRDVEPVRPANSGGPHPRDPLPGSPARGSAILFGVSSFGEAVARELVEAIPDGVVIVDTEGAIVFLNRQAETMFGYLRDDLVGRPVETLLPAELADRHRHDRAAFQARPHTRPMGTGLQLRARRHDDSQFPVEISLSPFETTDGTFVVAAVRDIGERLRADEELRAAHDAVATLEERERIARDLHDTVIQHIFAVGMNLQATEAQATDPAIKHRLQWAVDHLDETIREVRSAIFGLQTARTSGGLRASLTHTVADAARVLGFEPYLRLDGLIDAGVDATVGEQVLSVVREALSNVARHSGATRCDIELSVDAGELDLTVRDNGDGVPPDAPRGNGVANMEARAHALGGTFRLDPAQPRGTVVHWHVPSRTPERTEQR